MQRLISLFHRFQSDERGAFLAIFGILGVVLIALSGAVVDYVSIEQSRTRAQVALDAAVLALQSEIYRNNITVAALETEIVGKAQALLIERLSEGQTWTVCGTATDKACAKVTKATVDKTNGKLTLTAQLNIPLYFVALVGVDHMQAGLLSEATRGSMNVEVAVALDTTGSMAGQRIIDLKDATKLLIQEVVQDQQTPTYSKVALVPYSMGVNLGTYVDAARGVARQSTPITNIAWAINAVTVKSYTKTNPVRVTTNVAHNYSTGERVVIYNALGVPSVEATITRISGTEVSLDGVDGTGFGYSLPVTAVIGRCYTLSCELVVTSTNHNIADGKYVYIDSAVTGVDRTDTNYANVKNNYWPTQRLSADTYVLKGTKGYRYSAYVRNGGSWCTDYGCEHYQFTNMYGGIRFLQNSTCVSERWGTQAFTDATTTGNPVGFNYPGPGNGCITAKFQPLTSDKSALNAIADSLSAGGSTAAQIGMAWAWYAVSPNVSSIFPTASQAAAYTAPKTRKIVILMTDGEFNSPYCQGVIARNASSGSGDFNYHINCDSPNGTDAYEQAQKTCNAMKQAGITVYTVGFDIADIQKARDLMANCATDSTKAYNASNGAALKAAFQEIGASIAALRISR